MTLEPYQLLLIGAVYMLVALLSPKGGLLVLLPVVALAPEALVGGVLLRPDDLLMAVLVISWALRRMGGGRASTPLDRPLTAYVLVGLVATLWGAALGTADLWSTDQLSASGLHLLKRLQFVLYFYVLTDTLQSIDDVRQFTYVFVASLAALVLYGLRRFAETSYIALAPFGAAVHEPGLASMLAVALALGFLVTSTRTATTAAAGALLLGGLIALPLTLGRNYMISAASLLGLVALSRKRTLLLLVPVTWLLAPILLPAHVLARLGSIRFAFSKEEAALASAWGSVYVPDRLAPGLVHAAGVLTSSPLLGWGLGSVPLGFVDSEYATQLGATGIVGLAILFSVIAWIVRIVRESCRAAHEQHSRALPLVTGLGYCLLGYGLYSVFSPSISAARAGAFFFTIVGLLAVLHRVLMKPAPRSSATPPTAAVR